MIVTQLGRTPANSPNFSNLMNKHMPPEVGSHGRVATDGTAAYFTQPLLVRRTKKFPEALSLIAACSSEQTCA